MSCVVCQETKLETLGSVTTCAVYAVVRCSRCQLVFTLPRPTEAELAAHYSADYFTASHKEAGYDDYFEVGEDNMRKMWIEFEGQYLGPGASCGSMLDVGCASGAFLHEAKRAGWKTCGVELSGTAVERARSRYGLEVIHGDIFTHDLDGLHFDIITMWHVLEHTIDPANVLRRAFDLLSEGGLLFIELPNWNSLGRKVKGFKWKQLCPPAHINLFTPASLRRALALSAFEAIHCKTHSVVGFDIYKDKAPGWLRPTVRAVERVPEILGWGGYLRASATREPEAKSAGAGPARSAVAIGVEFR